MLRNRLTAPYRKFAPCHTENGVNRTKCAVAIRVLVAPLETSSRSRPKQMRSTAKIAANGIQPNFTSSGKCLKGSNSDSFTIGSTGSSITVNRR